MQSIIIHAPSDQWENEILIVAKTYSVSPTNKEVYSFKEGTGIEEVRTIIHSLRLKHTGDGYRMVVLYDLDYASIPAQNSLLKLLEEPPVLTILVVTCENINKVLDTIVSRCVVIKKLPQAQTQNKKDSERKILDEILSASKSQRLIIISKEATTREQAILLLTTLTNALYTRLHDATRRDHKVTVELLNRTRNALSYIEANVTPRAVIEILLIGFPHITAPS